MTIARASQSSRVAPVAFQVEYVADEDIFHIQINCPTSGVSIYYSTDGEEPTEKGLRFQDTLRLKAGIILKAKAFKEGWLPSKTGVLKIGE